MKINSPRYIGFCAFWLFSLLILAFSFKYYRPVFVVPNFTVLVIGIFMNLFAFGEIYKQQDLFSLHDNKDFKNFFVYKFSL